MKGAFITIEGIEGVGKTTSLRTVERSLSALGHRVLLTREPGGTSLGERIREWILGRCEDEKISGKVEALLMFAARAHHLDSVIAPALERGDWVVCDRFTDATFAYQGGGRGLPMGLIECLRAHVHAGIEPDLTLLLDAPVRIGLARIADRAPDHFEREHVEFFERVRRAYLRLAAEQPARIKLVDASRPVEDVERAIEGALHEFSSRFAGV